MCYQDLDFDNVFSVVEGRISRILESMKEQKNEDYLQ